MLDRIWIWFADNGNIRKWQRGPFDEGTEFVALSTITPAGVGGLVGPVSELVAEIHEAEWWQRGDENGQVTVSIAPERLAEAFQTLSARNAALEAENGRLRGDMQRIIDAPLIDHTDPNNNPASIARAALSALPSSPAEGEKL